MKSITLSGLCRECAISRSRFAFAGILGSILAISSMCAQAQEQKFDQPNSIDTPWNVLSTAPYVPDPLFNGGRYKPDFPASIFPKNTLARKIATLDNGDVVVAGLTTRPGGASANPINLGLVRYNSVGVAVAWTNPGVYGFQGNKYIVYPNSEDATNAQNVKDVLAIKVFSNRIFVLMDKRFQGGADTDVFVAVFGLDGQLLNSDYVFATAFDEYAGDMVIYSNNSFPEVISIAIVGSTFNGVWRPTYAQGKVNSNSSISLNSTVFPNPGNYCPTNRGCILRSIAAGTSNGISAPGAFFLAGSRQYNIPDNSDWDFLIMKVSASGSPLSSFGGSGVTTVPFNRGGDGYDDANTISVEPEFGLIGREEIYVSGFVRQGCKPGFGVAKLTHAGILDNSFGEGLPGGRTGKRVLGGAAGSCSQYFYPSADYAMDMVLADGKLAIAGFRVSPSDIIVAPGVPDPEDDYDGMIAVIDTEHGAIDSFRDYPYRNPVNGPRNRHSALRGITESSNGSFTAVGEVRFFQTAPGQPSGAAEYGTIRVVIDRIFASGFGSGSDY